MPKKTIYEENPWDDVKNYKTDGFKESKNLLPPSNELKKANIIIDGNQVLMVKLSPNDMESLQNIAKKDGVSSIDLATSILHKFVANTPTA